MFLAKECVVTSKTEKREMSWREMVPFKLLRNYALNYEYLSSVLASTEISRMKVIDLYIPIPRATANR